MESSDLAPRMSEIGSLRAHSNEESQFVGSSSGVYFINTVRQAFLKTHGAHGNSSSVQDFPPPEDTLVGSDGDKHSVPSSSAYASPLSGGEHGLCQWEYDPAVAAVLGQAPPLETARELMMLYFKVWHPLFPFLHGPTFLQAMELLYSGCRQNHEHSPSGAQDHRNACWTTIFQCVFNLASHLRSDSCLPPESRIETPSSMHSLLGTLTCRSDLPSLQALLASQLFLVSRMSLRTASTVGGCMLRSMVHAGLHRCPFRYRELSTHDRQLRKRIFWCAYAIDRYLSQALGLPLGIQDSDIDVCLPGGQEAHIPGSFQTNLPLGSWSLSVLSNHSNSAGESPISPTPGSHSPFHHQPQDPPPDTQQDHEQNRRQLAFSSYVESGTLTGRALELFHKSIFVRSIRRSSVLMLVTDVHKWWNGLAADLQGLPQHQHHYQNTQITDNKPDSNHSPFHFGPFFTVLYQHLILLINRPSLSLSPSTPEFGSALQTCIGAAREILTALTAQVQSGQALFWPGFLSAAWMSGLVLAFACQLRQYVLSKGYQEIDKCLSILRTMSTQWETAKHCHRALSLLAHRIQQAAHPSTRLSGAPFAPQNNYQESSHNNQQPRKKRRLDQETEEPSSASTLPPPDPTATASPSRTTPAPAETTTGTAPNTEPRDSTSKKTQGHPTLPSTAVPSSPPNGVEGNQMPLFLPPETPSQSDNHPFLPDDPATTSMMELDLNMVDLLQGGNFDSLLDMFGQQYPSF